VKGDQFAPEYRKLNPKAVVPTLVHDGNVIVESTVVNEYLDETFTDVPLKPKSAVERAEMRVWTKAVDENLHPACGEITFASCHRHIVRRLRRTNFRRSSKKEIVMQGLDASGIGETFRLYDGYLGKMEKALATRPWLAGETFSLADIAVTPYVNRLGMLGMAPMWEGKRPYVTGWFNRIMA
jgi:ganglioside-induced differentiation-associated protein 1